MFTVIAGVLNIMVIYDALAGPAFLFPAQPSTDKVAASALLTRPPPFVYRIATRRHVCPNVTTQ